jgi:hypothetical protein
MQFDTCEFLLLVEILISRIIINKIIILLSLKDSYKHTYPKSPYKFYLWKHFEIKSLHIVFSKSNFFVTMLSLLDGFAFTQAFSKIDKFFINQCWK